MFLFFFLLNYIVLQTLKGSCAIETIDGAPAEYTADLADTSSEAFMNLSSSFCDQVHKLKQAF